MCSIISFPIQSNNQKNNAQCLPDDSSTIILKKTISKSGATWKLGYFCKCTETGSSFITYTRVIECIYLSIKEDAMERGEIGEGEASE